MVTTGLDFGSESDGCLLYEDWRRRDSARKSEAEARLKMIRNSGRSVGMQAAMMMTFISMLKDAVSLHSYACSGL